MTRTSLRRPWRAALVAAALAGAAPARAGLGEPAASGIATDRAALSARSRGTVVRGGYTIERLESGANEVREYVSPAGVVFGVAWEGLSHPDLDRLLASYAPDYRRAAAAASPAGRRSRRVRGERVVVETWGHMRSLHGRAYAPELLPPGVAADAIR